MAEARLRARGEIGQASSDRNDQIGPGDDFGRRAGSFEADASQGDWRSLPERPFACKCLADGNAKGIGQFLQLFPRFGIVHAAAGDHDRRAAA